MYRSQLSRQLLFHMADLGLSQAEFCRRAGVQDGLISQVIRKNKPLPLKYVEAVIAALELSPAKADVIRRAANEAKAEAKVDGKPYVQALKREIDQQHREIAELNREIERLAGILAVCTQMGPAVNAGLITIRSAAPKRRASKKQG